MKSESHVAKILWKVARFVLTLIFKRPTHWGKELNKMRTLLLILISGMCFAQDSKLSLNTSLGLSLPMGEFKSTTPNMVKGQSEYDKSGYAVHGLAYQFGFVYSFVNHVGISADFIYAKNGNSAKIEDSFKATSASMGHGSSIESTYGDYQNLFYMLGVAFKGGNKLNFSISPKIGLATIILPDQKWINKVDPISYERNKTTINALAYGGNANVSYNVNEKFSLGLNLGILFTGFKGKEIDYTFNLNTASDKTATYHHTEDRKISMTTAGLLATYKF